MGQIAYRANLSAATYPMTIADGGRTVIMPGPDNNYDRRVDPQGEQKDAGIPQALYLENVLPTARGYQSVGYIDSGADVPLAGTMANVIEVFARNPSTETIITVPIYFNTSSAMRAGIAGEMTVTVVGASPIYASKTSTAVVRGTCYVLIGIDLYTVEWDGSTVITLTDVTATVTPLNFISTNGIVAICSAANYLVMVGPRTSYYSSTTTPLDFVSSLVSGAGQIDPNDIGGDIQYVKASANGFYVYSNTTVVWVQYTGNARYPWKSSIVKTAIGVRSDRGTQRYIAGGPSFPNHVFIDTLNRVCVLTGAEVTNAVPEVSDFLANSTVQELFDYSTNTFTATNLSTPEAIVYLWASRYVLVSINGSAKDLPGTVYTKAIIYDTVLQRLGRLKIDHHFIFTVDPIFSSAIGLDIDKPLLGFIDVTTKRVRYIALDMYAQRALAGSNRDEAYEGVLVLGKFQYARSRFLQLEEIEIEGPQNSDIIPAPNFSCAVLPSLNGRTFDSPVTPYQVSLTGGLAAYNCHCVGQNVSVALKGAFNVNTVQLKFTARGDR